MAKTKHTIIKCDRCGKSGELYINGAFRNGGIHAKNVENWGRGYDGAIGGSNVDYDFCEDCSMSFMDWLKTRIAK